MKFTKGKSGNPKGRPKTIDTSIRELINADAVRAYKLLWKSIQENQSWALELYFELLCKTKGLQNNTVDT